jgi:hypothetical protein
VPPRATSRSPLCPSTTLRLWVWLWCAAIVVSIWVSIHVEPLIQRELTSIGPLKWNWCRTMLWSKVPSIRILGEVLEPKIIARTNILLECLTLTGRSVIPGNIGISSRGVR